MVLSPTCSGNEPGQASSDADVGYPSECGSGKHYRPDAKHGDAKLSDDASVDDEQSQSTNDDFGR